ncbi:MAG: HAD-IG family 5'-nucleotidase [Acidobacteriota bacterium]
MDDTTWEWGAERLGDLPSNQDSLLLHHALEAPAAPPLEQRIFVNRTLRLEKIAHVGFDLDWTLADYHRNAMSELAFELTLDRLVENGYPKVILESEFRTDFCRRGLILDTELGMVLKMNRHRYVGRAYFGRRYLDGTARGDLYRREPINPSSNRFYHVDTLFELPEVNIFSEVIELANRRPEALSLESYVQLFRDTREAIDSIHRDGTLKARILADLPKYLPQDEELILALRRFALDGRKLLLITNSEWYYTDALCRHLFEGVVPGLDDWRELFDLVIVSAAKPGFFKKRSPFLRLDDHGEEVESVHAPQWGGVYSGGSREGLMELLDVPGEQVLYLGDHIYGDILSTKLASTWRTALVVSELEEELAVTSRMAAQMRHKAVLRAELAEMGFQIDGLRDVQALNARLRGDSDGADDDAMAELDAQLKALRRDHKAMRQHASRLQSRISRAINPRWGSLFKQGSNKSLFGSQVDDFACLYTSRVRNFARYGSRHYFRVSADPMMHEVEL